MINVIQSNLEQLTQYSQLRQQTKKRNNQTNNAVEVARKFDNVYGQKSPLQIWNMEEKKPLQIYTGLHALTYSEHAQSTL